MNRLSEKIKSNDILNIALPTMTENLLQTLVGFVDSWLIAQIGLLAVSGVGLANVIFNVYLAIFTGLGVATNFLVAKYNIADKGKAKAIVKDLTHLGLIAGLITGLISLVFGENILRLMGADNATIDQTLIYFQLVGGTSVTMALNTIFSSVIRATGDARTPLKINSLVNVVNIIIDWLLIFGVGPFPALGVLGTSLGTVIARLLGMVLLLIHIQKGQLRIDGFFKLGLDNIGEINKLFLPASGERLIMRLGQVIYNSLIVGISQKTFASHSIAGTVEAFTYMPAYGLSAAATILIGSAIGRKDYEKIPTLARSCVNYGLIIMSSFGIVLFFTAPAFAQFFTSDPEAISMVIRALRIDAIAQPAQAISMIMVGVLQGVGDSKSPMYATAIGIWGFRIIGIYLLGNKLGLGITGVWLSILADLIFRSTFLIHSFRKLDQGSAKFSDQGQ